MTKLTDAPCIFCGYNGAGYYQPDTHEVNCLVFSGMSEDSANKAAKAIAQSIREPGAPHYWVQRIAANIIERLLS